jgi:hypothetical protein
MPRVKALAGDAVDRVDWDLVKRIGLERTGIPTAVTHIAVAATDRSREAQPDPRDVAEQSQEVLPDPNRDAADLSQEALPDPNRDAADQSQEARPDPNRDAADQSMNVSADELSTISRVIENFPAK